MSDKTYTHRVHFTCHHDNQNHRFYGVPLVSYAEFYTESQAKGIAAEMVTFRSDGANAQHYTGISVEPLVVGND